MTVTSIDQHLDEDAIRRHRLSQCPTPYFQTRGRKLLVYQRPEDRGFVSKLLVAPKSTEKSHAPPVGVIVQIGDGWHPQEWSQDEMKQWCANVPFKLGDLIVWSKWENIAFEMKVHPEWWEGRMVDKVDRSAVTGAGTTTQITAIEKMRLSEKEFTEEFVIVEPHNIWGKSTAPLKEIWEK